MILNAQQKLTLQLASDPTIEMPVAVSFADIDLQGGLLAGDTVDALSSGLTEVDILLAPGAGVQRQIKAINVFNPNTVDVKVTLRLISSGSRRILFAGLLSAESPLTWTPGSGWGPNKGVNGKSAYEVWLEAGNEGTFDDFFESLRGVGDEGEPGAPGKSAYEVWLDAGNEGSFEDYFNSLKVKGDQGEPGPAVNLRGVYSAGTTYNALDGVEYTSAGVTLRYYLPAGAASQTGNAPTNAPWVVDSVANIKTAAEAARDATLVLSTTAYARQSYPLYRTSTLAGRYYLDGGGRITNQAPERSEIDSTKSAVAGLQTTNVTKDALTLYRSSVSEGVYKLDSGGKVVAQLVMKSLYDTDIAEIQADVLALRGVTPLYLHRTSYQGGQYTLDATGRVALSVVSSDGSKPTLATDMIPPLDTEAFADNADGYISLPAAGGAILAVAEGQSYNNGRQVISPATAYSYTARNPGRALMPQGGVMRNSLGGFEALTDLASTQQLSGNYVENSWPEFAYQTLSKIDTLNGSTRDIKLICLTSAASGQSYVNIRRGSTTYDNGMSAIYSAIAYCRANGIDISQMFLSWWHGESDYSWTTGAYKQAVLQHRSDMLEDISSRMGRLVDLPYIIYGPARGWHSGSIREVGSAQALWELAWDRPGEFVHMGPAYCVEHDADAHPTQLGQRQLGAYKANAFVRGIIGPTWFPTSPKLGYAVDNDIIHIEMHCPDGGALVADTSETIIGGVASLIADGFAGGFACTDKDGTIPVTACSIVSGKIQVELDRPFHPGSTLLTYAMRSQSGATGGTRSTGPRGIIRSTTSIPAIPGSSETLYHWSIPYSMRF